MALLWTNRIRISRIGLKEELTSKFDFKRMNADKIRFSSLKLKAGQSVKEFIKEINLEGNAAEEESTQKAIEVRLVGRVTRRNSSDLTARHKFRHNDCP
jgi:hypothetical protein